MKLRRHFSKNCPYGVSTDMRRLKQILINLTSNAMKFTTDGTITIDVDFDPENNKLFFSVIDTGIGIKRNDQIKLFKIFGKLQSSSK